MSDGTIYDGAAPGQNSLHYTVADADWIYKEIIGSLERSVGEPLYPGDERRIFGEALVAVFVAAFSKLDDAARQKSLRHARGATLDALDSRTPYGRKVGMSARTTLRFRLANARALNILIPEGTKATSDGSTCFATDNAAILQAGNLHVDIAASSVGGSAATNNGIPVGGISTLMDSIEYVAVSNVDETHGGDDGEPYTEAGDAVYRERIRLASAKPSTAGPKREYISHAMAADPSIADVSVACPAPGVVLVVPLLAGGMMPTESVLEKVRAALNADGVRPDTDKVVVEAPKAVAFDVEFKYYVTSQTEAAAIGAIEGAGGAIERYIAWQVGAIGRAVNPDALRGYVLRPGNENGALRMDVTAPDGKALDKTTVAQFSGMLAVSHEVVDE